MTQDTHSHWHCDRCGVEEITLQYVQPTEWIALIYGRTPLASPDANVMRWHLCKMCYESYKKWLTEPHNRTE